MTVTFNPEPSRLAQQLAALEGQVDEILVVDNASSGPITATTAASQPRVIRLPENRGVAAGFNAGVREARRRGASYVLLLDHDSIPTPGMVEALVATHERAARDRGASVAAVGPRVFDLRDRMEYPFIRLGWLRNRHLRCAGDCSPIECDFLISSGVLIKMASFDAIGGFDETLFIDSVDLEWCCRARNRGFKLLGACDARLDHWLGENRRRITPRIALIVHSPLRIYYMTRNRLLLYRRPYVPVKWKIKDVLRMAGKFVATMLLLAPRSSYARMTWAGIRDGLAGRGGPRP